MWGKTTFAKESPVTNADYVAMVSMVLMAIAFVANMFSTARRHGGAGGAPERWNAWHFIIVLFLIVSTVLFAMTFKPIRTAQTWLDKSIGSPLEPPTVAFKKTTEAVPAGATFVRATGKLTLPAAPVGFQWVVRYTSVSAPLAAPMDERGKLVGVVTGVTLPTDVADIEVQIVSLDMKSVSDFIPVP